MVERCKSESTTQNPSSLAETNLDQARELIEILHQDHDETLYADLASLIEARLAVANGDLEAARVALTDLIAISERDYVRDLARLRLARLQLAGDDPEAALATLEDDTAGALAAQRADIRGDAQLALDDREAARAAYQEALELAEASDQPLFGTQLKLDNLGAEDAQP